MWSELNYQFSLELSVELLVALSSNVIGKVAKADPNFYVNRWATSLITLFMHWWCKRGRTTRQQFGPSVLVTLDSPVTLELHPWVYTSLLNFLYWGRKGKAVWGSEKATVLKFSFSPSLSFLVQALSFPHTETMLSCGIFRVALDKETSSLC